MASLTLKAVPLLKVSSLATELHTELAFVLTTVNAYNAQSHRFGELDIHVANAPSGSRENGPIARFQARNAKLDSMPQLCDAIRPENTYTSIDC